MRALVTGGCGFMGSHLVDELVRMGHEVTVVDDLSGGFLENHNDESTLTIASITDTSMMDRVFRLYKPELVFHLAAYAAEGLSPFIRRHNYMNNVVGSANIINQCIIHKVKFLCFTSSMAVYGNQPAPFHEALELMPIDPYGIAKMAVERDIEIAGMQHGLQYVIMRPHNVYGPNQNIWDPYRNVIGIFMRQILEGKPLTIFGDGSQVREFTYIDDITPHIARVYRKDHDLTRTYNLGIGERVSVGVLAEMVCEVAGVHPHVQYMPPRHEVDNSYPSTGLFKRVFSPGEPTGLVNGLERMWAWAQEAPRKQSKLPEIEVRKGLYRQWENV